jgi:hypothetical protein
MLSVCFVAFTQEVLKKSPEVKGVLATYASRSKKTASLDPHKRKAIGL